MFLWGVIYQTTSLFLISLPSNPMETYLDVLILFLLFLKYLKLLQNGLLLKLSPFDLWQTTDPFTC